MSTRGFYSRDYRHWMDELRRRFCLDAVDSAIPGSTVVHGIGRFESDVARHSPQYVFMNFGMNDHVMNAKDSPAVTLADYEASLRHLIDRVRAIGAVPILLTPSCIDERRYYTRHPEEYYSEVGGALAQLDRYIEIMASVGRAMDVAVVDIRRACDHYDPSEFTTDGVHLSELGHRVYADVIASTLSVSVECGGISDGAQSDLY